MQKTKAFDALTNLLPSSKSLLALATRIGFVLRKPRKITPGDLFRSVLVAVAENTPHFRSIAEKISALSSKSPSRQAVFQRLKQDSAVDFFFGAFQQVLREQTKRFIDPELEASLEKSEAVFNRIIIEDGSVIPLHGSLSAPFKGSSNQFGDTAALRLRWAFDFRSGETIDAELHHWRENDMSTTFDLLRHVRPGDLLLRDMGYFCLEALHEIHAAGAWFITRIPEGTGVADLDGKALDIPGLLAKSKKNLHRWEVKVGKSNPVKGRIVAMRIDPAKAAERKRRLRGSCRKHGITPTRKQLAMCEWVVVFTNCGEKMMGAETIAQLYRLRWMVEIFFKGMKSGQNLEKWSRHRTNANTIQCLAYAQMIMGVLSLNLWRTMGRMLNYAAETGAEAEESIEKPEKTTVGPIKAFESLVPLLVKVFAGKLRSRRLRQELERLAGYAKQEKRTRMSLDALADALLS